MELELALVNRAGARALEVDIQRVFSLGQLLAILQRIG